jgi:hypothetical protein
MVDEIQLWMADERLRGYEGDFVAVPTDGEEWIVRSTAGFVDVHRYVDHVRVGAREIGAVGNTRFYRA